MSQPIHEYVIVDAKGLKRAVTAGNYRRVVAARNRAEEANQELARLAESAIRAGVRPRKSRQ